MHSFRAPALGTIVQKSEPGTNSLLHTRRWFSALAEGLLPIAHHAGMGKRRAGSRYRRGIVTILDRRGLQRLSCECYGTSKREFDRLLDK